MSLREDQQRLVAGIRAAYRSGARSVVAVAPPGFGKTHMTAKGVVAPALDRGLRVLFAAGLDSIITDTHAKVMASGLRAGILQADRPSDPDAPVQVASWQTLHVRSARPYADLVIIDEAHHAPSAQVRAILESYGDAWILGLTGTPQRGDGRPLGDLFSAIVQGPSNRWLIERGLLVPCDVLAPASYLHDGLIEGVMPAYRRLTPGTRAIAFCESVAHAVATVDEANSSGVPAALFVGETPREEREQLRSAVAAGKVKMLVGVAAFVEGFDLPSVETVILARSFSVTGAFLQAVGRGMRLSPSTRKQRCTVLDLRGSVHLHGLPDEDRVWSLTGAPCTRSETFTALQRCSACMAIFRPSRRCPRCGAEHETAVKLPRVLNRAEKLERLNDVPLVERDRRYLARLEGIATTRMRMPPQRATQWAHRRFVAQFGREPATGRTAA